MQSKDMVCVVVVLLVLVILFVAGCSAAEKSREASSPEKRAVEKTAMTKSCDGFTYFTVLDHKLTPSSLLMYVQNGPQEVIITEINFGNVSVSVGSVLSANMAGDLISSDDSTSKSSGEEYSEPVTIVYELSNGPRLIEDHGTCRGIVQ